MAQPTQMQSLEEVLRAPTSQHVDNLLEIIQDSIQTPDIELQITLQLPPAVLTVAQQELQDVTWLDGTLLSSEWHDKGWLQQDQAWIVVSDTES
eukprot:746301-Prorocentrum_lima.AAC.1